MLLFLSSYAPLFAILAYDAYPGNMVLVWVLGATAGLSIIALLAYVKYWLPRKASKSLLPEAVHPRDGEAEAIFYFISFHFLT